MGEAARLSPGAGAPAAATGLHEPARPLEAARLGDGLLSTGVGQVAWPKGCFDAPGSHLPRKGKLPPTTGRGPPDENLPATCPCPAASAEACRHKLPPPLLPGAF